jgi:hypothetical protein
MEKEGGLNISSLDRHHPPPRRDPSLCRHIFTQTLILPTTSLSTTRPIQATAADSMKKRSPRQEQEEEAEGCERDKCVYGETRSMTLFLISPGA